MKMKRILDGWHIISGYRVYVEDGRVLRGILGNGNSQRTAYPYRACRTGGWDNVSGLSVDAFRAGVRRGSISMF